MKAAITVGFILAISAFLLFTFPNNRSAVGQSQFLPYENPDYKIRLQYPSDWTKSEESLLRYQVVRFSAPEIEQEETSLSIVIFTPADLAVAVIPISSQNTTIENFTNQLMEEIYATPQEYRIINSSKTNFAGTDNAQSILMYEYSADRTAKVMRTIAILNNSAYMIKYAAEPGLFSEYLPVAQKMIDSFGLSSSSSLPKQSISSASSTANSTTVPSNQELTESNATSSQLSQQTSQTDVLLQPNSNKNDLPDGLPKTLTVTDSVWGDHRMPLRTSIISENATKLLPSESRKGELSDWYPVVIFHFNDPPGIGIISLEHVLSGPIKPYASPEDILEDANYWKNVPLNQQAVLEMNQPGLNYLIAEVLFANGMSGVYSSIMDVQATGTKSDGEDYLDYQMDQGGQFNAIDNSEIEDIQSDAAFQRAASNIICSDLNSYGFQVCQPGSPAIEVEQPTINIDTNAPFLFGDEDEDEDDNDNEDEDNDNNDDDNDNDNDE